MFIVDHAHTKATLGVRVVKRLSCAFDFGQELLPVGERVSESSKDVFSFKVPERLELEPFGDIIFDLLYLGLDQVERSNESGLVQVRQLQASQLWLASRRVEYVPS